MLPYHIFIVLLSIGWYNLFGDFMKNAIIFDLDGTLWDTTFQVAESWNSVFKSEGIDITLTPKDIEGCMGLPMDEIFRRLLGNIDADLKDLRIKCEEAENDYLLSHGGLLYKKAEQTLKELKAMGYHLYIVSNCQDGYIQTFLKCTSLAPLFDDIEMWGRTGLQKGDNIRLVIERNHIDNAIYLGDTQGDFDACKVADVPFVFAKYGMGNAQNPPYSIEKLYDITTLARKILAIDPNIC